MDITSIIIVAVMAVIVVGGIAVLIYRKRNGLG